MWSHVLFRITLGRMVHLMRKWNVAIAWTVASAQRTVLVSWVCAYSNGDEDLAFFSFDRLCRFKMMM